MADKKQVSVENRLRQLHALQLIDSELDQIEILKGELPIEVSDLEDEVVGLETRLNKLKEAVDDIESEISKHKANIEEAQTLEGRYKKQLDEVKNNREYDALSKEIELQGLVVQLSEKKIRDAQAQIGVRQETVDEFRGVSTRRTLSLKPRRSSLRRSSRKQRRRRESFRKNLMPLERRSNHDS